MLRSVRQFSDIEILEKICQTKMLKMQSMGYALGHEIPTKRTVPLIKPFILQPQEEKLQYAHSNYHKKSDKKDSLNRQSQSREIQFHDSKDLSQCQKPFIIAEIKRASPTRGNISPIPNPLALAKEYLNQGASAISVLCEEDYFQGNLKDLQVIKAAFPYSCILRKDFILHKEEIAISYLVGADMVLLIAGIFLNDFLYFQEIYNEILRFNLTPLLEIHDKKEWEFISKLNLDEAIVGINSRDLRNFKVNKMNALKLRAEIPAHIPVIFESGVEHPCECFVIANSGFAGILCGSFLVSSLMPHIDSKNVINTSLMDFYQALQQGLAHISLESPKLKSNQSQGYYRGFYQELLLRFRDKNQRWVDSCEYRVESQTNHHADSRSMPCVSTSPLLRQVPLVKVCGINDLNFLEAAMLRADLLGFILTKKSVRFVDRDFIRKANQCLQKHYNTLTLCDSTIRMPLRIGVVLQDCLEVGLELLKLGLLDALQLHDMACAASKDLSHAYFSFYPALKMESFLINKSNKDFMTNAAHLQRGQFILWDSSEGQNSTLDTKKITQFIESFTQFEGNLWLAGGINKENLANILTFNPMLIDICSGFESEKGIKDRDKFEVFFKEWESITQNVYPQK